MKLQLKRKLIINKRNGQASVTIPSKFFKKLKETPSNVLLDFSNSLKLNELKLKKG